MRVIAGLCFAFLSSLPAYPQTAAERAACESDYKKFCEGVQPGDNRIIECLAGHLQSLSAECKKVVEASMPK
jgi:hypothetical protein